MPPEKCPDCKKFMGTDHECYEPTEDHAIGRLLDKIVRKEDGCWYYEGFRMGDYGGIWALGEKKYAHRFAYEGFIGPIPEGKIVMHKCDVPRCVNPCHLKVGTHSENQKDMVEKGRRTEWPEGRPWGPENPAPKPTQKLSDEQVREMRARYEEGEILQKQLAEEYGIDDGHASRILRGLVRREA